MAFEDLDKKLYSPQEKEEKRRVDALEGVVKKREAPAVREAWQELEEEPPFKDFMKYSSLKKIVVRGIISISIVVFIVIAYFLYQAFTFGGISLKAEFEKPVLAGVPFNVTVNYSNNSPSLLTNAKLLLTLGEEFSFVGGDVERRVQSEDIGTLGVGTIGQKIFQIIANRGEGSCAEVVASIEYNTTAVGSRFEKKFPIDICVSASAAELDILYPKEVFNNEIFDLPIRYRNISEETLKSLELQLEYPQNFTFQGATLTPDEGDNVWYLGDLRPGSSNEIVVRGNIIAEASSFFEIKVKLVAKTNGSEYIVTEKFASVSILSPPLPITVAVQGRTNDYVANPGESLDYTLQFRNTADVGFSDVVVKVKLIGEMFDLASVEPRVNLNSITRELSWNKSHLGILGLVPPGEIGTITFRVKVRETFPIRRLSDKDFTLRVEAQIDSPTVPPFIGAERTVSIAKLETKVAGLIAIESTALFRDAASGIVNKGPIPPKVNTPTNYTVHWVIRNYGTDVADVELRAFLKPGVRGTGVVKSNIETVPTYNDRTQEVIWRIPKIQATRGVVSEPIEGIFQIEALPAVNQAGNTMPLVGEVTVIALDLFTNLTLNDQAKDIDTALNGNDPTLGIGDVKVQP